MKTVSISSVKGIKGTRNRGDWINAGFFALRPGQCFGVPKSYSGAVYTIVRAAKAASGRNLRVVRTNTATYIAEVQA